MKIIEDGKGMEYHQLDNGTCYSVLTPVRVVEILEKYRNGETRIRVFYGDQETGHCWMEENDTMGTIGRSTGRIKVPLLIKTKRSFGGGAILDSAIVKITVKIPGVVTPQIVYQHPKFNTPLITIRTILSHDYCGGVNLWAEGYTYAVDFDGVSNANFKTKEQARRYIAFMEGRRNSK